MKIVLSPQRRDDAISVGPFQRKPLLNKKAALKTKIQDILSGRSRFVIRKVPAVGSRGGQDLTSGGQATSNGQQKEKVYSPPSVSRSNEEVKTDRYCLHATSDTFRELLKLRVLICAPIWYSISIHLNQANMLFSVLDEHQSIFCMLYFRPDSTVEEGKKIHGGKNSEGKKEQNAKEGTQEKKNSKKKGKGKKGNGRGKKSNREASETDITALREFLDSLRGTRRLMVRTFSFCILSFTPNPVKLWIHIINA